MKVFDDVLGCFNQARAGGGLVQIYHFIASEAVRRGELVEVVKRLSGRARPFSVLYPQNRHMSARVRAFVDFLISAVGALGRWLASTERQLSICAGAPLQRRASSTRGAGTAAGVGGHRLG